MKELKIGRVTSDETFRKQNCSNRRKYRYRPRFCKVLANEGAHVLALDISDKLDDTVKEINEAGGQATAYKVDISDEHQRTICRGS